MTTVFTCVDYNSSFFTSPQGALYKLTCTKGLHFIIILVASKLYSDSVHVELALHIAIIHCAIRGCTACATYFSQGFWYGTLPYPIMFKDVKLLAALMSNVRWCKSHAHISFLSEVIEFLYVATQHERNIAIAYCCL